MTPDQSQGPLDRLEATAQRISDRATYENNNRISLLWIHGLVGFLASIQMLVYGSASTVETALGPWMRIVLATLGILGGGFLLAGVAKKPRSLGLEAVGLCLLFAFDLVILLGIAYARFKQDQWAPIGLGEPIPAGYVVAYPITIYAGLSALIVVHLVTLKRAWKAGR